MIADLYNIKVNVERPAFSQDDYGAAAKAWTVQISNMPCRLVQKKSAEGINGGNMTVISDYVLYCATSNSILGKDRVVYKSEYYLVVGIDPDVNFMGSHQKIYLLKIKA